MFLPDGNHFLYLAANFIGEMSNNTVFLGSLDSPERHPLVNSSGNAAYVEPGYLLYLHDRTLVAQKFDLRRYAVSGEPHLINEEVMYFPQVFRAVFSASGAGVLVTQDGKSVVLSQLTWFDRSGKEVGILGAPGAYNNVRLSPDDRSVAEDQTDVDGRNIDVWVLGSNAPRRLTFDPALDQAPIWSPNGKQVLYDWTRSAGNQLFLKNADGSGTEEQVSDQSERLIVPWDWSRNGQYILFRKATELWYLTWPDRTLKPYLQTKWTVRNAQFSPDGKWVVYASNETGSMEIYVSPFPNADSKWQVSSRGGEEPRWRGDGRELFYVSPEGMLMAVPVAADSGFTTGSSVPLFQIHRRPAISAQDVFSYDVSKDGQRVLVITKANQAASTAPSVVLNWTSEFEK
jgi:Tol biopolymer transport system component